MGSQSIASVGTRAYDSLIAILRDAREGAGVSQRELSRRLGRPFSYIAKIERGTRRIDIVELILLCDQLAVDPVEIVSRLKREMQRP